MHGKGKTYFVIALVAILERFFSFNHSNSGKMKLGKRKLEKLTQYYMAWDSFWP